MWYWRQLCLHSLFWSKISYEVYEKWQAMEILGLRVPETILVGCKEKHDAFQMRKSRLFIQEILSERRLCAV